MPAAPTWARLAGAALAAHRAAGRPTACRAPGEGDGQAAGNARPAAVEYLNQAAEGLPLIDLTTRHAAGKTHWQDHG
jgi:hypothetical protein